MRLQKTWITFLLSCSASSPSTPQLTTRAPEVSTKERSPDSTCSPSSVHLQVPPRLPEMPTHSPCAHKSPSIPQ